MAEGTYTLFVELSAPARIEVGALGHVAFPEGWYAYTGSAFGPGGFARVDRHYELAAGDREGRHWHVDYLLGRPEAIIRGDVRRVDADVECAVASALPEGPAHGFGASDCSCRSHLAFADDGEQLRAAVEEAYADATGDGSEYQ